MTEYMNYSSPSSPSCLVSPHYRDGDICELRSCGICHGTGYEIETYLDTWVCGFCGWRRCDGSLGEEDDKGVLTPMCTVCEAQSMGWFGRSVVTLHEDEKATKVLASAEENPDLVAVTEVTETVKREKTASQTKFVTMMATNGQLNDLPKDLVGKKIHSLWHALPSYTEGDVPVYGRTAYSQDVGHDWKILGGSKIKLFTNSWDRGVQDRIILEVDA